jgi:hypothetical protein
MYADPLARCKETYKSMGKENSVSIRYLNHVSDTYGCKVITADPARDKVEYAQSLSRTEVLNIVFNVLTPERVGTIGTDDTDMQRIMDHILRTTYKTSDASTDVIVARDIVLRECILRLWFDDFKDGERGKGLIREGTGCATCLIKLKSELPYHVQATLTTMIHRLSNNNLQIVRDGLYAVIHWLVNHKRFVFYAGSPVILAFIAVLGTSGIATPAMVHLAMIGFLDVVINVVCGQKDSAVTWGRSPDSVLGMEFSSDLISCVEGCVRTLTTVIEHIDGRLLPDS